MLVTVPIGYKVCDLDKLWYCIFLVVLGIISIFTFFPVKREKSFRYYALYWVLMLIENTVMISLWYTEGSHGGTWYHDVAVGCVIAGYFLSFAMKTLHCCSRNRDNSFSEWEFW